MTKSMTDSEMMGIAWGDVERNLGDQEDGSADALYDEAYGLALKALLDAGVTHATARSVASRVAQRFAQP